MFSKHRPVKSGASVNAPTSHALLNRARASRNAWIIPVVTLLAIVAVIVGAILISSVKQRHVQLDDGTVWVTSAKDSKIARYNVRLQEADSAIMANHPQFDIAQHDGNTVLTEGTQVSTIAPSSLALSQASAVQVNTQTVIGGNSVAFLDSQSGDVWVSHIDDIAKVRPLETDAPMALGDGGRVVVNTDGVVYGYRPRDGMVLAIDNPRIPQVVREVTQLDMPKGQAIDAFTVIGDHPMVSSGSLVVWDRGQAQVQGAHRVLLQAPPVDSEQTDWAVAGIAGGLAVFDVRTRDGNVRVLPSGGTGEPAQPVSVGGCVRAAWSQHANNYVRLCAPDDGVQWMTLQEVSETSYLLFRVNHRLAVLNDVSNGNIWNPDDATNVIKIQWKTVETEQTQQDDHDNDATSNYHTFASSCSAQSGRIRAMDDHLSVRAGSHEIIDVLRNDQQTDCSVLRITQVSTPQQDSVKVTPIYDGRYVQVDASSAQAGTVTFTYAIDDGKDQSASATVTLDVVGKGNHAPQQEALPEQIDVEQGASTTINALGSFHDADGDPLTLVGASVENTDEATVSSRADGQLTFHAGAMSAGRASVRVTVSDGQESTHGMVYFTVRPAHTLPARIDPVVQRAVVNTPTRIVLQSAIHGTSSDPARLTQVETPDNTTTTLHATDASFTMTANETGTYYVPYTVHQGTISATGLARVEVQALTHDEDKPIAANDVALLDADNTAIVEPLKNDVDPMGGVLVLTEAHADSEANLTLGIASNKRLYITATRTPTSPVTVTYTVANAVGSTTGSVIVQPPAFSAHDNVPKARNVTVDVRTGGIVSVDVRDYVSHSASTTMTLSHDLQYDTSSFKGLVFVASNIVRYQAPAQAGTYPVTYTVSDTLGNRTSATITFTVHESDANHKAEAAPQPVEAQVSAGQHVRIPITLRGIDPDGDDVQLLGLGNTAPQLGRISEVGADYLVYEAYQDSVGTDEFTYAIEDWTGSRTQASVRVGVVQQGASSAIYARDDRIVLRPNTTISVPVTANDVSHDASTLTLQEQVEAQGLSDVHVHNNMITLTTPATASTGYVMYTVANSAGLRDNATLMVTVDPKAPIDPPTASDYRVPATATIDRRTVDVDVAQWITNPSGSMQDVRVGVHPSASTHARVKSGTVISVDLTDEARAIPYTVTNTKYGVTSTAFIQVPAYGVFPPILRPNAPALTVNAGSTLLITIADYVRVGAGKTAIITDSHTVSATKAANHDFVANDHTLKFTAPKDYDGPASITFTVSDGKRDNPNDDEPDHVKHVNSAVLTLPITVIGHEVAPPTFSSTVVDVVAGEAPIVVDLTALTNTTGSAQERTLHYQGEPIEGAIASNITADGKLSVSASADATPGTTTSIPFSIDYGNGTVNAGLTVRVVASLRPLARIQSTTTQIHAGQTVNIPVTANAYNPFPDTPLTIVSAKADDSNALSVIVHDNAIQVTAHDTTGAATSHVTVTVADATGNEERQVSATFTFAVSARPNPPLVSPFAGDPQDGVVTLSWTPGNANGSEITDYEVQWNGGQRSCGAVTTCHITGLTNGIMYTFTVRAKNAVGWSDISNAVQAMPDRTPEAPTDVHIAGGHHEISVAWQAPQYAGTRPQSYSVQLTGPHGWTQQQSDITDTNAKFSIPNNVIGEGSFSATVTAHNAVGASAPSAPVTTTDVWGDPDNPTVQLAQTNDHTLTVRVTPGKLRGTGCSSIMLSSGGTVDCAGGTSTITLSDSMYFKDYTVRATIHPTKQSVTPASAASNTVRPSIGIGKPQLQVRGDHDTCIASWTTSGKADRVHIRFGSINQDAGRTGEVKVTVEPWQSCPTASAFAIFQGESGQVSEAKSGYVREVAPTIDASQLHVAWASTNHDAITITNNHAINTYGKAHTVELRVGNAQASYTVPWNESSTTLDVAQYQLPDDARWSLKVTIQGFAQTATLDWTTISGTRYQLQPRETPSPTPIFYRPTSCTLECTIVKELSYAYPTSL